MKLLDRLVLKDLLPMFFVGVALFFTLYFAAGPILLASRFLALGVPWPLVVKLVALHVPPILALTFPMGMLLSALIGFGRLSADSEAVALFAGGIPFLRIAAPAAALGLAASLIGYVINDHVASSANAQIERIIDDVKRQKPGSFGETSRAFNFENRPNGVLQLTVHVEKGYDVTARAMRQVTITTYDASGQPNALFYAANAQWHDGPNWTLSDATVYHLTGAGGTAHLARLNSFDLGRTPEGVGFLQRDPDSLDFRELRRQIALLRAGGSGNTSDVRNAEVGLWSKIALPFASLVFALVGAPLGLRPQRTAKQTGWILSVLIIFVYYVLYTTLSSIARGGGIAPPLAAFLPDLVGLAVGLALIWQRSV